MQQLSGLNRVSVLANAGSLTRLWDAVQRTTQSTQCGNGRNWYVLVRRAWLGERPRALLPFPALCTALLTQGNFRRQIPTTTAVSRLAVVGSACQNPRGGLASLSSSPQQAASAGPKTASSCPGCRQGQAAAPWAPTSHRCLAKADKPCVSLSSGSQPAAPQHLEPLVGPPCAALHLSPAAHSPAHGLAPAACSPQSSTSWCSECAQVWVGVYLC